MRFDDAARPSGPGRSEGSADEPEVEGTLDVVTTVDGATWAAVLEASVQYDFHHLAAYHRVAEHQGEGRASMFVYRDRGYTITVPLLLRLIDDDPAERLDATSVYGYAGPIASHADIPAVVIAGFQRALLRELERRKVVAVFSRLHPLIEQRQLLDGLGEIRPIGPTVSVDLTLPAEEQWAGYKKKCRQIIRRALEAGVVCVHDEQLRYRHEWADMYGKTMRRVEAAPLYRLDEPYFERLSTELGSVLHLFVALVDEVPVAAGLYTICDGIVQAHLGASRAEYARLSPTRALDDAVRRWATAAGARVFHLGGGVGGHEDSLFQYKAGFSDRRHSYAVWRWIIDARAYAELAERRTRLHTVDTGDEDDGDFFPAYRRSASIARRGR